MKKRKILTVLLSAVMLIASLSISASAAGMEGPVGDVTIYYGTPTVDGVISEGEYDGARELVIDSTNMKALEDVFTNSEVPESLKITTYQLWDSTGLYLAFEVKDETPALGYVDSNNNWHFNANNIQIFLDPGPTLAGQMLLDTETRGGRRSPMYVIGVNEDGTVYVLRQLVQNEMIANLAEKPWTCGGKETDDGWTFELRIPWDELIVDVTEKVAESTLSIADVKDGMKISAMFIYNDLERNGDSRSQIGMYETHLQTMGAFDWQPEVFGINLILSETVKEEAPPYEEPEKAEKDDPYADLDQVTVDPDSEADSAISENDTQTEDNGLPWGWVIGIGSAVVVVAAAVVAGCLIRRKKAAPNNSADEK